MIIFWDSLMASAGDDFAKSEQVDSVIIKILKEWAKVFETLCKTPKSQLGLLNRLQLFCHEDSRFLKHFSVIVQQLYKNDAVCDTAILYWFEKVRFNVLKLGSCSSE